MNGRTILSVTIVPIGVLAGACDRSVDQDATTKARVASAGSAVGTQPDNTARNRMDRDSEAKSPIDQSNSSADIKITADIRRAIMDDKSISTNAQNCKIITDKSGVVTLRGPVDSQAEKDSIESIAKAIAGASRVVNELEIKQN